MPQPEGAGQASVTVIHPSYKIVKGVPAAIVRSYKQPLWDSEVVLAADPDADLNLFARPIGQDMADGTQKTLLHTNMRQAGQLGTPESFDVYGYNARLTRVGLKGVTIGNFDLVMGTGIAEVFFTSRNLYLEIPIEDIPSGVDTEGLGATDEPHIGHGTTDNLYRFDVGGQAIHIASNENFSVRVTFPGLAGTTGNLLYRWYIRGVKYRGV